jgi:NAD(P)H-hydrate epimerase
MADIARVTAVPRLPPRPADAHKGTYGRVLVVAGRRGMTGAAILCGGAALRGGAGLVTVACPDVMQGVVAVGNPCYTTVGLPADAAGGFARSAAPAVTRLAGGADALAVGPGVGTDEGAEEVVVAALAARGTNLVLDADGLNVLARLTGGGLLADRAAETVLTPHPGEFARLLGGRTAADVQAGREGLAVEYARQAGVVLLLKGHRTVVTDGARVYLNGTGNPGMATGGTGDVLTGLVAALLGQGLGGFEAAVVGAWAHGRAGDLAAGDLGQTALTAADVLAYLPKALREVGP